jgi:hypothetical protein
MCRLTCLHKILFGVAVFFLVILFTAGLLPVGFELRFQPVNGGKPLLILPLETGEQFILHYIHSVDKAPVWEVHSVDSSGTIYIEEERFVMFGAGMGHWDGHGILTKQGSYQVIENIHEPVGNFLLRVGNTSSPHSIIWRDMRINLSDHASGQVLHVSVHNKYLLKDIWRLIDLFCEISV